MYQKKFVHQAVIKIDKSIYDKLEKKVQEKRRIGMRVFVPDIVRSIFHILKDSGFVPIGIKQPIKKRMKYPQCRIWIDKDEYNYLWQLKRSKIEKENINVSLGDWLFEYIKTLQ